jgi:hypothetical protein
MMAIGERTRTSERERRETGAHARRMATGGEREMAVDVSAGSVTRLYRWTSPGRWSANGLHAEGKPEKTLTATSIGKSRKC